MKKYLLLLLFTPFVAFSQITDTISTSIGNMVFNPDTVIINIGESVHFQLTFDHNAVEVDSTTWVSNGTNSNSGFTFGNGMSGDFTPSSVQTYYYVCQNHVGMKGVIIVHLPGCTDTIACNYNPAATIDDGSCNLPDGCTDILACNYDPLATCDDGSCNLPDGCIDTLACNYDPLATCDDGSCLTIYGCTDPLACNYDSIAVCDDGLCLNILGCTNVQAVNYNALANCDDGSCLIAGFTADTVCEGFATTFTDLSSGNIASWNWDMGDGGVGIYAGVSNTSSQNPQYIYLTCGVYTVTLTVTDTMGYVSIDSLSIEVLCPSLTTTVVDACESYTWLLNGTTYYNNVIDTVIGLNANGCEELNILDLTINGSSSFLSNTSCDSYTWVANGQTYDTTGLYIFSTTNPLGCTHIDSLDLIVNSSTMNLDTTIMCDSFTWMTNGVTYDTTGIYTYSTTNSNGCPDTSILNLTINYTTSSTTIDTACDSYTWNGITYDSSGVYTWIGTNDANCDSTAILNLTTNYSTTNINTITACGSYMWTVNGFTYDSTIVDTVIGINAAGCTETNILNLTVNYETITYHTIIDCDSYTWPINGVIYYYSIIDTVIGVNASGCAEIDILNLTINNSSSSYTSLSDCDSYTWPIDGQTYVATGIYSYITTNSFGCLHIDSLDLTISYSNTGSSLETACDSLIWEGITYYTSGSYNQTFTNVSGCDSTHTLMLDINYSNAGSLSLTDCDSYNWNGQIITSSGSYNQTFTNVAGCDSIATLNLTIYPSTTSSHTSLTCDSYTWNGITYDTTGIYTWTGVNSNGCDSIATLDLTIDYSTISVFDTVITCPDSSYVWNGQAYYNSIIDTIITIIDTNTGCLHLDILILTINDAEYNIDSFFVCDDSTVVVGNDFYSIPGLFTDTVVNSNGCLSISGIYIEHLNIPLNPMTVPNPPMICLGDSIVIEVNDIGFVDYWWNTGNPSDQGENRVVVFPTQDFIYVVEALDFHGCESREEIQVFVDTCGTSSITENILTKIKVYPNPSQNVFNVNFNILQDQNIQLRVINSIGDVIFTEYLKDYIGQYSTKIILDNHSKGIYLLQIRTDKLIVNKKLILQ